MFLRFEWNYLLSFVCLSISTVRSSKASLYACSSHDTNRIKMLRKCQKESLLIDLNHIESSIKRRIIFTKHRQRKPFIQKTIHIDRNSVGIWFHLISHMWNMRWYANDNVTHKMINVLQFVGRDWRFIQ